ncbi:hypothetical protein [Hyunsoonleella rubra]|uniref:Uncharacterized protein n=1 Tax=Hyunsoonleella rubra TaxID=1737062 RepID=A0ABW5TGR0_9FLAO
MDSKRNKLLTILVVVTVAILILNIVMIGLCMHKKNNTISETATINTETNSN